MRERLNRSGIYRHSAISDTCALHRIQDRASQINEQKCGLVYQPVYDSYFGQSRGVYQAVA